jgi:hypothetical protein
MFGGPTQGLTLSAHINSVSNQEGGISRLALSNHCIGTYAHKR